VCAFAGDKVTLRNSRLKRRVRRGAGLIPTRSGAEHPFAERKATLNGRAPTRRERTRFLCGFAALREVPSQSANAWQHWQARVGFRKPEDLTQRREGAKKAKAQREEWSARHVRIGEGLPEFHTPGYMMSPRCGLGEPGWRWTSADAFSSHSAGTAVSQRNQRKSQRVRTSSAPMILIV
jgi:hypothetical protein